MSVFQVLTFQYLKHDPCELNARFTRVLSMCSSFIGVLCLMNMHIFLLTVDGISWLICGKVKLMCSIMKLSSCCCSQDLYQHQSCSERILPRLYQNQKRSILPLAYIYVYAPRSIEICVKQTCLPTIINVYFSRLNYLGYNCLMALTKKEEGKKKIKRRLQSFNYYR